MLGSVIRMIGTGKVDLVMEEYNDGDPVIRIDVENGTVTRLSTGEVLSFALDANGYNKRPLFVEVQSETDASVYHVYKPDEDDPRTWICDCPDFRYRRFELNETCKHIGFEYTGVYRRMKT